ncbi:hypothetical protein BRADI_1g69393v3 [Brachypodium distachyon]|uniref:Uncharacterized protein n=1 Tax=Brachypodium distachyon TaxID=15368 RepID=A0A2K2DU85_BRADI|nr:hypothetical protein BRADI_1g69393v3 [Brachypodium distachyon]
MDITLVTMCSLSTDTHLSTIADAASTYLPAPWFQIRATVVAWLTLQACGGACRQGSSAAARWPIPFAICSYHGFNRHHGFRRSQVSTQVVALDG